MPELGDEAICKQCGGEIEYIGPYWRHAGKTPRHVALPVEPENTGPVEIYIRPKVTPQFTIEPHKIRLNYCGHWIDCRAGEIQIRDINGKKIKSFTVKTGD